jgi:hypothetical protein
LDSKYLWKYEKVNFGWNKRHFMGNMVKRNDVVFDKNPLLSYMQVIYRATHWTRTWSLFQKEEERQQLQDVCQSFGNGDDKDFCKAWMSV